MFLTPEVHDSNPTTTTTTEEPETTTEKETEAPVLSTTSEPFVPLCPASPEGDHLSFVRHPFDCSKFFVCVDEHAYAFQCPHELYFDMDLKVCNFPEDVDCPIEP